MTRTLRDIRISKSHEDITSFVFISSLTLLIPTFISMFELPFVITVILFAATMFSALYHSTNEQHYESLDVWWANLTSLVTAVLFTLVALKYPFFSWHVLIPFVLGAISLYFYFNHGAIPDKPEEKDVRDYDKWHGIWHLLSTVTLISLMLSKIDFSGLTQPYINVYKKNVK